MKLVVGLGNPGKEYENTRHNIGFFMLDKLVEDNNFGVWKSKFNGLYVDCLINNEKVIFLKPQSYMNLSGEVVRKFVDFYKINIEDILIISDDLDLFVGNFRLRDKGSSGGHNGLKNIALHLGTEEYKRIKIGISNDKNIDTKDYVLGKFSKSDIDIYNELYNIISKIILDSFNNNFHDLMSKYNRKNR